MGRCCVELMNWNFPSTHSRQNTYIHFVVPLSMTLHGLKAPHLKPESALLNHPFHLHLQRSGRNQGLLPHSSNGYGVARAAWRPPLLTDALALHKTSKKLRG